MAVYRRSARSRFTLTLLILTSITLLTLDFRGDGVVDTVRDIAADAIAPVQSASDAVFAPVGRFVGGVVHYGGLQGENERLRRENDELRGAALRADDAERERQALLSQLDLAGASTVPRIDARVVSTSPSNFELTVQIDKGTDDGVINGMPIATGAGLVGRVIDTSRSRSTVRLITDRDLSVGVRITPAGAVGITSGAGFRRPLTLDFVDPETEAKPGDVVVTSGLQQSVYPPGIPVGTVRRVETRPGELEQRITIDPVVDFDRLAFVAVLLWSPA
ncbi:MAG: rod shape-determining protein MreC [Acidimicrobiales bacterium]